ncbi:MAG: TlpA family protein disulfide reductase [Bacteroidetes bacterium]|nr:TlpA family protein disulfide reductase [Bacteroidota bacterium]
MKIYYKLLIILFLFSFSASPKPEIKILNFDQFKSYLHKDDGQVYVINFWATWCKPCVEELPAFEKLNAEYRQNGVKVILVSLDEIELVETKLKSFISKKGLKSEVILLDDPDFNSWINQVNLKWTGAIPATLVYKGKNSSFHEGSLDYKQLLKMVKSKL